MGAEGRGVGVGVGVGGEGWGGGWDREGVGWGGGGGEVDSTGNVHISDCKTVNLSCDPNPTPTINPIDNPHLN